MAAGILLRLFCFLPALFEQRAHVDLHQHKARKHQRRAEIAPGADALAEQEEREDRREHRLEREDKARAARCGVPLKDALDHKADARAHDAEEQRRRPDLCRAGQRGRFQKDRQHRDHHADDGEVTHAERQRIDPLIGNGPLGDHQVDRVEYRRKEADHIAEGGLERFVQRHQRKADKAQQHRNAKLLFRLFAVDDELQNRRRHHGKRADESRVGNGRIEHAVGKARIHDDERQSDQNAVLHGHEAHAAQILAENKAKHQKGRDKAEGIERQRLHILQANRRQAI